MLDSSARTMSMVTPCAGEWLLLALQPMEHAIASATTVAALCDAVLPVLGDACGAVAGSVALRTGDGTLQTMRADGQFDHPDFTAVAQSMAQAALHQRRASMKELISLDLHVGAAFGMNAKLLTVPLLCSDAALGVVQLITMLPPPLGEVQLVGTRIATAIDQLHRLAASEQRNSQLQALIDIMRRIGATLDRDQILHIIIDAARWLIKTEASSLFLLDPVTGDAVLHTASGGPTSPGGGLRVPAGQGVIGHVLRYGETVLVADVARDTRHYRVADQKSGFVTRSLLTVPLRTHPIILGDHYDTPHTHIIGGLQVINKQDGTFTPDDARLLEILAQQAATVFEIATLYANANDLFLDMIRAFSTAIDAKDPYTEGHSQRVSDFAVAIAQQLDLSASFVHHVRIGATLHDIGKIGVPDEVLRKPDALTPDEYALMQTHPLVGAKILEQVRMLRIELPALTEHHERLDGSGYPNGLQGDDISLLGRIVGVADVFDALASDRPYRPALPVDAAFAYLQHHANTLFDAACVDALIRARAQGRIVTQRERAVVQDRKDEHL